jgi:uncharacterized membrane protein
MTSDAAIVVDSTGSHAGEHAALPTRGGTPSSQRAGRAALKAAATSWFVVAASGQIIFAVYVVVRFGPMLIQGRFEDLNEIMPHAYVAGDTFGNLMMPLHLALAGVVMVGGILQLIPGLRRRWPAFHRWNGRVYLVSAVIVALGGLFINVARGIIGGESQAVAVRLNAFLVIAFAAMAFDRARARRIDLHRRWALRLFLVASGVWFGRIGFSFWLMVNQGPVGFDPETFEGPVLTIINFAQYLLPLLVLELYFRAQDRGGPRSRIALAASLAGLTLVTAAGIAGASHRLWLPHLL